MPFNSSLNTNRLKRTLKNKLKDPEIINICQVSLKRDIPLIQKNYFNFKNIIKI